MAGNNIVKALYAVLVLGGAYLLYGAIKPASTRVETGPEPAPPADTGPAIPDDVLRVPPAIQAMSGIAPDPDHGVWFMPYALTSEEQGIAMVQALRAEILRGNPFPQQLQVPEGMGAGGRDRLYRAEPGVARFYIGDINNPEEMAASESRIPLIISQPHPNEYSADVIFLDGHLESVPVGTFPLSKRFLTALETLDPPEHAEERGGKS